MSVCVCACLRARELRHGPVHINCAVRNTVHHDTKSVTRTDAPSIAVSVLASVDTEQLRYLFHVAKLKKRKKKERKRSF